MESFTVIIPARYASTRLPGKPLLQITGKPLIQHVYESATASCAERVIVATDDDRIKQVVGDFSGEVILTSDKHQSGTDRIAEVVTKLNLSDERIVVNVQGDEFGLSEKLINQLAQALSANAGMPMATLYEKIPDTHELYDPNVVKVIADRNNRAIYFSRLPIPWQEDISNDNVKPVAHRHIGMYAYRVGFLKEYTRLPVCQLEQHEKLEQLRAIYHGHQIYVEEAVVDCGMGIDTEEDLEKARGQ